MLRKLTPLPTPLPQGARETIKPAFTLAEVLITLGIIGIVAALTIPNLVTEYQKKAAVSGLREAYSILSQAVKSYAYDSGEDGTDFDVTLSPQEFAEKYFKPYLKVAKVCTSVEQGCWKTDDFYGYYDLSGQKKVDTVPYSLVLTNGMIIGFGKIAHPSANLFSIIVDVNGHNRKNIMGHDVFAFYPFNSSSLCTEYNPDAAPKVNNLYIGGFDNCGTPHVAFKREDLMAPATVLRPCNKTPYVDGGGRTGAGSACAAVIMLDGWKISKDYPW